MNVERSESGLLFPNMVSSKATASIILGEIPSMSASAFCTNPPVTPSLINYMASSMGGSFPDVNKIGCESDEEFSEDLDEVESLIDSESIDEHVKAFRHAEGPWATYRFNLAVWDTPAKARKLEKADTALEETYSTTFDGVLNKQIIAPNLSRVDRSPEFDHYAYTKCVLVRKKLTNIDVLNSYPYLQFLDISSNKLTTLKALENLPFLKILDASHNLLTSILDFKAPFFLTNVNLSYNKIKKIRDLSEFWSITDLNLAHNSIKIIEGLKDLRYLTNLKLGSNRIETIENLNNLRIQYLCIQNNAIKLDEYDEVSNLDTLKNIRTINLSYNKISSLKAFENVGNLESLDIVNNNISKLLDIYYLRHLKYLNKLNLNGNPIVNIRRYVEVCVTNIKNLTLLDGEHVNSDFWLEKLSNMQLDTTTTAGHDRIRLLMLEQLNPPQIWNWLVPYNRPPLAVIVLVGLQASRRAYTARTFCNEHETAVVGIPYTTKPKQATEVEGDYFYYVNREKFISMLKCGEFLTYQENVGNYYGIAHNEFKKAENGVIMFYTDLTMALAIKRKFLNTVLVLALPSTRAAHVERLSNLFAAHFIDKNTFKILFSPEVADVCQQTFEIEKQRILKGLDKDEEHKKDEEMKTDKEHKNNVEIKTVRDAKISHKYLSEKKLQGEEKRLNEENVSMTSSDIESHPHKVSMSDIIQIWWAHTPTHSISMIIQPSMYATRTADVNGEQKAPEDLTLKSTQLKKIISSMASENAPPERTLSENSLNKDQNSTKPAQEELESAAIGTKTKTFRLSDKTETLTFDKSSSSNDDPQNQNDDIKPLTEHRCYADILSKDPRMKAFFLQELRKRDELLELHLQMPGLFREVLFTDQEEETMSKLKQLVKNIYRYNDTTKKATLDFAIDEKFSQIIKDKIDDCFTELRKEVSISEKQSAEFKHKSSKACSSLCDNNDCLRWDS